MRSTDALKRRLDNLEKRLPQGDVRFTCYWGDERVPDIQGALHIKTKWGYETLEDEYEKRRQP